MMEFVHNMYTNIRRDTKVTITDTQFIKKRSQKIGKTTYIVTSYHNLDAKESTIDKLKILMLHNIKKAETNKRKQKIQ